MTAAAAIWSFVLVVGLLTLTPGLDTALIVRTAAVGTQRQVWGVVLGIQWGTLGWGLFASAGVAALLAASQVAFEIMRWAGAAYLIWMGLNMLWASRRSAPGSPQSDYGDVAGSREGGFWSGWRRGVLTNMLNPKMGAFYASLLSQFIPSGASPLLFGVLLTCVHIALGTAWSVVLVLAARRARRVLERPTARRMLDRAAGMAITGFGLRLLVSDR